MIPLFVQKILRRWHFQVISVTSHGAVAKGRVSLVALAALEGIKFLGDGFGLEMFMTPRVGQKAVLVQVASQDQLYLTS